MIRSDCRICGGALELALRLAPMPLVDDYESGPAAKLYPTDLMQCIRCSHVQLGIVVPADRIFRNYSYRTGYSPGLVAHFKDYAQQVTQLAALDAASFVIDVGSNDGTLLKMLRGMTGCEVLGIDPAAIDGMPAVREMLTERLAHEIISSNGRADLITANNILAHVDDIAGFLAAVSVMLKPDGYFVCEVGDADEMLRSCVWEQIYHEHLNYFDEASLRRALSRAGFNVIEASRIPAHGGSISVIARQGNRISVPIGSNREFGGIIENIWSRRSALAAFDVDNAVAFGASAKASVMLWQLGLRPRVIVDDNPAKQGKRMPGTNIPICSRSELAGVSQLLILAWNEAPAILRSLPEFIDRTIIAAPEPYVI